MKRLIAILFLLSVSASAAGAQDFDKGLQAYEGGDDVAAFAQLLPLAERGDAKAQYIVHLLLDGGKGIPQDAVASIKWLKSAANLGLGNAQFSIGRSYFGGSGVPQDNVLAYMWLNLASGAQIWLSSRPRGGNFKLTGIHASEARDFIVAEMTPAEIKEAQRRSREWLDAHPR